MHNNQHITIDNQTIKLRRLHNPDKRIILSNVFPNIPNSPISFLQAGSIANGLYHVLSFRRQLFVSHDDIGKLSTSMLINYDSANYKIFLSNDTVTCFLCKKEGHTFPASPINANKPLTPDKSFMTSLPMNLDIETNKNILSPIANQAPSKAVPNEKSMVFFSYVDNSLEKDNQTTLNISTPQPAWAEISQTCSIKRPAPPTASLTLSSPQSPKTHTNQPKTQKKNQINNKK